MGHYYAIAAYIGFASLYEKFTKDRNTVFVFMLFCTGLLIAFAGFRFEVGPDQGEYVGIFNEVPSLFDWYSNARALNDIHGEYGYLLLNAVVKLFTTEVTILFVISALVAVSINIISFRLYSKHLFLCIFVYYAHAFMHKEMIQIRTGIASAIVLFSVNFIVTKDIKRYVLTIIMAVSFHVGAIVALPLYYICSLNLTKRTQLIMLTTAIAFSQVHWIKTFLEVLGSYGIIPSQVATYVGWDLYDYSLGGVSNPTTFKQLVICLICSYFFDQLSKASIYFRTMFYMYLVSTVWLLLFNDFAIIATRIATYLSVCEPVIVSYLMQINKRYNYITIFVILAMYAVVLYLNLSVKELLTPYKSVLAR